MQEDGKINTQPNEPLWTPPVAPPSVETLLRAGKVYDAAIEAEEAFDRSSLTSSQFADFGEYANFLVMESRRILSPIESDWVRRFETALERLRRARDDAG